MKLQLTPRFPTNVTGNNGVSVAPGSNTTIGLSPVADQTVLSNISGAPAPPIPNNLSALFDAALGSARGSLLYRGAAGWALLAPGVAGNFLKTQGPGADLVYAVPAGGGNMLAANNLSDLANKTTSQINLGVREVLTATRTLFVRTDGNDANTGLVNNAGGAKLTLQAAWNALAAVDANGQAVAISVADGTYTAGISAAAPIPGAASISITGNTVTPANCVINCTNANGFVFDSIVQLIVIGGFKLTTAIAGDCMIVRNNANVRLSGNVAMDFGACAGGHMTIDGGTIASGSNYNITGSAALAHFHVINWGNVGIDGITVTLTGTPNFGSYFAGIASGIVTATGCTFNGAATGQKYVVHGQGYLKTNGVVLPGSVAGSAFGGNLNDTTDQLVIDAAALPVLKMRVGGVDQSFVQDSGTAIVVSSNAGGTHGNFIVHGADGWTNISDERLPYKRTARDITDKLPALDGFRLYENEVNGQLQLFVKAQEFNALFPHQVHAGSADPNYVPSGMLDPNAWGVQYDRVGIIALAYIKQLEARLAAIEAKNLSAADDIPSGSK